MKVPIIAIKTNIITAHHKITSKNFLYFIVVLSGIDNVRDNIKEKNAPQSPVNIICQP